MAHIRVNKKRYKVEEGVRILLLARDRLIDARKELSSITDSINTAVDEFIIETIEEDK